jgi:hypothetical protein
VGRQSTPFFLFLPTAAGVSVLSFVSPGPERRSDPRLPGNGVAPPEIGSAALTGHTCGDEDKPLARCACRAEESRWRAAICNFFLELVMSPVSNEPATSSITDEQARDSLVALVRHVYRQRDGVLETLTYEDLAELIHRLNRHGQPAARGMGKHVLGRMGEWLQGLSDQWGEPIPYIQTIVVLKSGSTRGLPDVGIEGLWPGYSAMTRSEKEAKLGAEYQRILQFGSRWNDVLTRLGFETVVVDSTPVGGGGVRGQGGESAEHKALKRFVLENPELVGAGKDWAGVEEYPLKSFDEIDVLFRSATRCIGVEVKSVVSDRGPQDYERGIYQVVKYKALLKAQARAEAGSKEQVIPGSIDVFLVLQSKMPEQYIEVAKELGVRYFENVTVPNSAKGQSVE